MANYVGFFSSPPLDDPFLYGIYFETFLHQLLQLQNGARSDAVPYTQRVGVPLFCPPPLDNRICAWSSSQNALIPDALLAPFCSCRACESRSLFPPASPIPGITFPWPDGHCTLFMRAALEFLSGINGVGVEKSLAVPSTSIPPACMLCNAPFLRTAASSFCDPCCRFWKFGKYADLCPARQPFIDLNVY